MGRITTGHNDGTLGPIEHATMEDAVRWIEAQEKLDPDGVFRGNYYIDAPEARCKVELDGAGWSGWPRYTCYTCGETLIRKPFHGDLQWEALRSAFVAKHAEPSIKYGKPVAAAT